jgi:hypothetical protein
MRCLPFGPSYEDVSIWKLIMVARMENVIKLPDIYAWKKTRLWKDIISVFFSP